MNGRDLALGLAAGLAGLGLAARAQGSRSADSPVVIIGVGSGARRALELLASPGDVAARLLFIDTNVQELKRSRVPVLRVGVAITRGLGTMGDAEIGQAAAEADVDAITQALAGAALVIVVACLGGGTGSGAGPVVARLALKSGATVFAVVDPPLPFEGRRRERTARVALDALEAIVPGRVLLSETPVPPCEQGVSLAGMFARRDATTAGIVRSALTAGARAGSRSTKESRATSRAARHAEWARRAGAVGVTFRHGGDSLYRDQYDGYILAVLPNEDGQNGVIGRLDWSEFQGKHSIKMVEVAPEFRRLGLATKLYAELFRVQGIRQADLDAGWRTPEGDAFRKGTRFRETKRGAIRKQGPRGSRAMRQPTDDVGLAIGESDQGPPAVLLLDLKVLRSLRTRDDLRSAQTRVFKEAYGPPRGGSSTDLVTPGALLGYIRLGHPRNEYGHVNCGGDEDREPLQVTLSAAVPGWGPLLYDCALWVAAEDADNGFLIPDRGRVFDEAEKVWRHYIEKRRGEIVVRPVPAACVEHGDYEYNTDTMKPHPYLDQMVRFRRNSRAARAVQPVFERGRDAVEAVAERFGVDEDLILADLVDLGEGFFAHRFDG
jgi:GNAT superfamily N-acetyltransferase